MAGEDLDYVLWVKRNPCCAAGMSACQGGVEADHTGRRGLGQKAHDNTCISLCSGHHAQRDAFWGPFRDLTRERMRAWLDGHVVRLRVKYLRETGIDVTREAA